LRSLVDNSNGRTIEECKCLNYRDGSKALNSKGVREASRIGWHLLGKEWRQ